MTRSPQQKTENMQTSQEPEESVAAVTGKNGDYEYCLRCHRKLKNPIARQLGYGKVCEMKMRLKEDRRYSLFC